jgi:predicted nucleic acid-binding protein
MKKELVLIDSNIWLYSFLRVEDKSKYEYITKFLKEIITNSYIVITTQIINEVSYNLKRKGDFTE